MKAKGKNHSKFKLKYHIVLVCKYRLNLLQNNNIADFVKQSICNIADNYDFTVVNQNTDNDHIHILVSSEPNISPLSIVRAIKQQTTFQLWNQFHTILQSSLYKEHTFWSDGYYVSTTGSVSLDTLKNYIENQGEKKIMEIHNSQKLKLNPNQTQISIFNKMLGEARAYYNHLVYAGKNKQKKLEYKEWIETMTWDMSLSPQSFQQCKRQYKAAIKAAFESGFGFPTFRRKTDFKQSFKNCMPSQKIDGKHYQITGVGKVKMCKKIRFDDFLEVENYTVSRENGYYWISFLFKQVIEVNEGDKIKEIGIDLGLKDIITTSDGESVENPKWKKEILKIKSEQRKLSRKQKKSNNYYKQNVRLSKAYKRHNDLKSDFKHKLSARLVNENQVIYLEDLNMKGMMKNRHVSNSFQQTGIGGFVAMLKYKSWRRGVVLIQVSRWFPSSKLCFDCGWKHTTLRLSEREWTCPNCGAHHHRDVNAARNILREGQKNRWADGVSLLKQPTVVSDTCVSHILNYEYSDVCVDSKNPLGF